MATVEDTKCETNKPQRYCKGKTLLIIKGTWDNESGGEIFFCVFPPRPSAGRKWESGGKREHLLDLKKQKKAKIVWRLDGGGEGQTTWSPGTAGRRHSPPVNQ